MGPFRSRKPLSWPPAPEVFAFDAQLRPVHPAAPALEPSLQERFQGGDTFILLPSQASAVPVLEVLVRMPWEEGACAYLLVRQQEPPEALLLGLPPPETWVLPTLIVLGAVLVTLGPVVRRVRRLTSEVRATAASSYQQPVPVQGGDEVADLARAFEEARQEIRHRMAEQEAREQALRDFLANTTHDVMTPLTVLLGHLSSIQQRLARGELVESSQVASALDEAHYMSSLVHNLAVAARLEAGEPQVQRLPVDLNALVARALGRHQPFARQQQVALESGVPEQPVWVEGDVTLLEQAVSNVILNGVRYNQPGGHVAVVLESTPDRRFQLRVLDDGPGIPEEEREKILQRRMRGNAARTRHPQGQGLGLSIASDVAELHGWTLTLLASDYGGLEVRFSGQALEPPQKANVADTSNRSVRFSEA